MKISHSKIYFSAIALTGAIILSGFFVASISAEEPSASTVDSLNQQIKDQNAKIDELTKKIVEFQDNIKINQKEALTLKSQISLLDNQIGKTAAEIKLKEEQAKEIQLQIEQTGLRIDLTEEQLIQEQTRLAGTLRLIARYEDKNYINIILTNDTFSDFFDQLKFSSDLQQELQRSYNRIKETGEKLAGQKKELESQKEELSSVLNKLDQVKDALTSNKDDKNQLVVATKKSEKKFQTMVADLKKQQAAANSQVAALEKKLRAELAKKGTGEKFNSLSSAILSWPTDSHRITSTFHDPDYPYRNLFEHSGLDIGIKQGTQVRAAEAGYIAKVAYGTQWYGTYVMIIHGGNITTLYGHLSAINVTADQYVTKGQVIGASGNTGFSSGPHLHLEVRSNGVPVNPLNYLP